MTTLATIAELRPVSFVLDRFVSPVGLVICAETTFGVNAVASRLSHPTDTKDKRDKAMIVDIRMTFPF
jgi:hypothetical protein